MKLDADVHILECTDMELYQNWLNGWCNFCDYNEYKRRCKAAGTVITDEEDGDDA